MFSRKTAFLIGIVFFVATSFSILTVSSRTSLSENGVERIVISFVAPFQMVFSNSFAWCSNIWRVYFNTVKAGEENIALRKELAITVAFQSQCRELELENSRLRRFIDFSNSSDNTMIAAKVIGRDPSPWFQTLMIDKGGNDGLVKGLPVLVSEGIVGQIVSVSNSYSRVLLITDRNSSVDALVQSSRARGIVQGNNTDQCLFKYALRKDEIMPGDIIISSGLDQVFPKGLRIGEVLDVGKESTDLFQTITIKTFVDFDKLEEVLVSSMPAADENGDLYVPEEEDGDVPDEAENMNGGIQQDNDAELKKESSAEEKSAEIEREVESLKKSSKNNPGNSESAKGKIKKGSSGTYPVLKKEKKIEDSNKALSVKNNVKKVSSKTAKPLKKEEE